MDEVLKWIGSLRLEEDADDVAAELKPRAKECTKEDVLEFLQSLSASPMRGVAPEHIDVVSKVQHEFGVSYDRAKELLTPYFPLVEGMGHRIGS